MKITDCNGTSYNLTKELLEELPKCELSRYVILVELKHALKMFHGKVAPVRYYGQEHLPVIPTMLGNIGPDHIGCRPFTPEVYAKIMAYMNATKGITPQASASKLLQRGGSSHIYATGADASKGDQQ